MTTRVKDRPKYGNKISYHMKLHLGDGFGADFSAYAGVMMKEGAVTSFTLELK